MTTSHKAGYRCMIGYIQASAVQRLNTGTPETIFPVRSASGSVPVYIDPDQPDVDARLRAVAELVKERCAKISDQFTEEYDYARADTAEHISAAIRALKLVDLEPRNG